jgi:hypothetical protein
LDCIGELARIKNFLTSALRNPVRTDTLDWLTLPFLNLDIFAAASMNAWFASSLN